MPRLLENLALARGDGLLCPHAQEPGARAGVDPGRLGITPLTAEQWRDLLEPSTNDKGRASIVVSSQLPVAYYHEHISNPAIADAVLDRLVHTAPYRAQGRIVAKIARRESRQA